MWGGIISNPTIMYRKSITENIPECYNVTYRVSADMDFFEKTLSCGAKWVGKSGRKTYCIKAVIKTFYGRCIRR